MGIQLLIGFVLAIAIAVLAWRVGMLGRSGVWAAVFVGGLIFGFGGVAWAVILLTFYLSSSVLSQAFALRKSELRVVFSKGGKRDWGQVLANGGLGAALAVVYGIWCRNNLCQSPLQDGSLSMLCISLWVAYCGAIAAVTADTWATELGVLSRSSPRMITDGKKADRGTSGAVSLLGSLASLCGALLIGLVAAFLVGSFAVDDRFFWMLILSVMLGGISGSVFDSLLGATLQGIYYCPVCQKETERSPVHNCGTCTTGIRGLSWLNNDLVNFFASFVGMVIALGAWILLS